MNTWLSFLAGALVSWFLKHFYYRLASKYPPEWAKPLIENLPDDQPSDEEFTNIVNNSWQEISQQELISASGSNSDGEWIKYTNGEKVCKGNFTIKNGFNKKKTRIPFPSSFSNPPSVDLSGPVSNIESKNTTVNELIIKLKDDFIEGPLSFKYCARGQWS